MLKKVLVLVMIVLCFLFLNPRSLNGIQNKKTTAIVQMPELLRPETIHADGQQLYITDKEKLHIYGQPNVRHLKTLGRAGEGPQEFLLRTGEGTILLTVKPDTLEIYSTGKISLYKKDGTYIKEWRTKGQSPFYSLGNNYLGILLANGQDPTSPHNQNSDPMYHAYFICDSKYTPIKQLSKFLFPIDLYKKKWYFFLPNANARIYKDHVYLNMGSDLEIKAFNASGATTLHIQMDYEKIKVTNKLKQTVRDYFDELSSTNDIYGKWKSWLCYPDYLPAVKNFLVANSRIYVQTYQKQADNQSEFFIFSDKGKLIKKCYLPIIEKDISDSYPYTIENNTLFQIVEDIDNEKWLLHITPIE